MRSPRLEFSSETKRIAFERSGGVCECHRVPQLATYGVGCGCELNARTGIYYEHIHQAAIVADNSIDNAAVLVRTCWRLKSDSVDKPVVAHANRVRDKLGRNIHPKQFRPLPGTRASGIRRRMNGTIEHW